MTDFPIIDKRRRTAAPAEPPPQRDSLSVSRLRARGFSLPASEVQAQAEVRNAAHALENRSLSASMRRTAGSTNMQMAVPKVREPMSSFRDKNIPYDTTSPRELREIRRWCNTPDAPVWMGDYTFKAIGDIEPGEQVIGWENREGVYTSGRRELVKSTVLAVNRRVAPEVVQITFESGRTVKCTPDHEWLRYYIPGPDGRIHNGPEQSRSRVYDSEYAPLVVGSIARSVIIPTEPLTDSRKISAAGYLAGIIDGEGSWSGRTVRVCQSPKHNPGIVQRIDEVLELLDITHTRYVRHRGSMGDGHHGDEMVVWEICRPRGQGDRSGKNRQQLVDIFNWSRPVKMDAERMDRSLLSRNFGEPDRVVSIESIGSGEVVSMQTTTGNYTAWGFASKNCRLFYSTHDLIPLLVDIYSKFPMSGIEIVSRDKKIAEFYEDMFFNQLDYENFLNDLGREYFISGEVNSLAHFDEMLGIWSAEEILNPDHVSVSRSMFVKEERVQLLVKEIVENLIAASTQGTGGAGERTLSEAEDSRRQLEELQRYYPEMIQAASNNDGIDLSDALISRIVNKLQPWDLRGTPHLLRSFRTLLMEESLNAAQDAVADRLYSPFVLATLGIQNLGDGQSWIPSPEDLDAVSADMQSALAADFRLMVHHMGLDIRSVFGREAVPRFDTDYNRIDKKLMQAWGIGEALISGSNSSTYASSAINREFVTQMMSTFQKQVVRHMRKRMLIIAEAQEHYDYEMKGDKRVPVYREIVEEDENGEPYIRKVPKLLIPDVRFAVLNLRDENQERQFLRQLRDAGVPIADSTLAVNIPMDFNEELEKYSEERVNKLVAEAQAMEKTRHIVEAQGIPYPPDLLKYMAAQPQYEKEVAEAESPSAAPQTNGDAPAESGGDNPFGVDLDNGIGDYSDVSDTPGVGGEGGSGEGQDSTPAPPPNEMQPRNRTRPPESDEQRGNSPRAASLPDRLSRGPSSVGHAERNSAGRVDRAITRTAMDTAPSVRELVESDDFFIATGAEGERERIRADIDEIYRTMEIRGSGENVNDIRLRGAARDVQDSFVDLISLIDQYESAHGVRPVW